MIDIEERIREVMDSVDLALAEPGAGPNPFLEEVWDELAAIIADLERDRLCPVGA